MPTNVPDLRVAPRIGAVQYDGTNAAFIAGCLNDGSVNSSSGSTCNLQVGESFNFDCPVNHWVLVQDGNYNGVLTPEDFEALWVVVPSAVAGIGVEPIPTLGASTQTTVSVNIVPPMLNEDFTAAPGISGAANLLANLTVLSHSIVDESTVDVVVRNNGLLSLGGATLFVVCTPN
jgi:hypothetical protein